MAYIPTTTNRWIQTTADSEGNFKWAKVLLKLKDGTKLSDGNDLVVAVYEDYEDPKAPITVMTLSTEQYDPESGELKGPKGIVFSIPMTKSVETEEVIEETEEDLEDEELQEDELQEEEE